MTRYCVDPARRELLAAWGCGEGDLATRIAALPASADTSTLLSLARALTQLSDAAWRAYTRPASAAGSLEPNTELAPRAGTQGLRRGRRRDHQAASPPRRREWSCTAA
ncbi:hypothetical protein BX265_5083 [Streptomyces sp. TLI_235]|nr:hypothetical protein BX265_5083 [Streptomyces sp. TLI_235]